MASVRYDRYGNPAGTRMASRLWRERRGVTAVEFGLIAMPLMGLMIATLQIATTMFTQQVLETTAEKAGRLLLTGRAQNARMSQSQFKSAVCGTLAAYMKCDNLLIDVQTVDDFSSAVTTLPTITYGQDGKPNNKTAYSAGNPGDIVVLRVMYVWGVQGGPLGFDISNLTSNRRMLMATSVFRSENY